MTYMQSYELDAWLGDTELTDEQCDAFARMVAAIADRYPGRDHGQHPDEESITEAMTGALQVLLGDDTLFEVVLDTALPQGQPTEGFEHPSEDPYPVQGRSLVVLRHRCVASPAGT